MARPSLNWILSASHLAGLATCFSRETLHFPLTGWRGHDDAPPPSGQGRALASVILSAAEAAAEVWGFMARQTGVSGKATHTKPIFKCLRLPLRLQAHGGAAGSEQTPCFREKSDSDNQFNQIIESPGT
jgi:hypothetical protein